jgi:hypothetical protein
MVPVGRGVQHEYQSMLRAFTCCVGTGMESHALHGDGLFYEADDRLWVNLYAPCTAQWAAAGARLTMDTDFPEGETARLTLALAAPRTFTLLLRRPYWAGDGFTVSVNGHAVPTSGPPPLPHRGPYARGEEASTYVEITRSWRSGDSVDITLPKSLRLEPTADMPGRAAILWGPLVLAGDLGPEKARGGDEEERIEPPPAVPVLVAADRPVASWLTPSGTPVRFRTDGVGREPDAEGRAREVEFVPFYRLHRRTYGVYWDLYTPDGWEAQRAGYVAESGRRRALEAATVGYVVPGDDTSEQAANYQAGPRTSAARIVGRPARRTRTWVSFDLPVEPERPMALVVEYFSGDRRSLPASFDILVDGTAVAAVELPLSDPQRFFEERYPVPAGLVRGKSRVTVRLQANEGSQVAAVFGIRTVRAEDAP